MLARAKGLELPAWTEEGLRRTVFKDSYTSLDEYLKGFSLTGAVMDDASSVERIAYELASLELVRAAVAFRDAGGARIVGFDIAGSERGYPASNHREAYEYAHRNFLHKTQYMQEKHTARNPFLRQSPNAMPTGSATGFCCSARPILPIRISSTAQSTCATLQTTLPTGGLQLKCA